MMRKKYPDGICCIYDPLKEIFDFTQSPDRFARKIGVPLDTILNVISNIDDYYEEWVKKKRRDDGSLKLKKGRPQLRVINPSKAELKWIQSRVKDKIFSLYEFPINIQGGLEGRDNITNARLHLGKKYHLCSDLSDFFPSISHKLVYNRFVELGFSQDVSSILTKLTTFKGRVPQGAPTSTHVCNLAFYPIDEKMIRFCKNKGIVYSRFVDDIILSAGFNFKELSNEILKLIHLSPFRLNHRKTFYTQGKALVTGIMVANNVLDVKEAVKKKMIDPNIAEESRKSLIAYRKRTRKIMKEEIKI